MVGSKPFRYFFGGDILGLPTVSWIMLIAAVVVGGTASGGAVGRMTGTLLGVIFIAMIGNGLVHWGIDPDLNKVVRGIIIFLAVVINSNLTLKSNTGPKGDD